MPRHTETRYRTILPFMLLNSVAPYGVRRQKKRPHKSLSTLLLPDRGSSPIWRAIPGPLARKRLGARDSAAALPAADPEALRARDALQAEM